MILATVAPKVANRCCRSCLAFVYDEQTGEMATDHRGEPLRRSPGTFPPCYYGACEKGSPDSGKELTPQNRAAWRHYRKCQAVGRFPEDAYVAHNALIIADAEAEAAAMLQERASRRES